MEKNKIITCQNCPKRAETNHWSSDGWDHKCDWVCQATLDGNGRFKVIAVSVEWYDERHIKVPDWCPLHRQIVIKGVDPPKLPNQFTEDDLRAAFEAGMFSREASIFTDENGTPYIDYFTVIDFDKWIKQYKETRQ